MIPFSPLADFAGLPDRAVDRPPGTVIAAVKAMLGELKRAGFRCPRAERTGVGSKGTRAGLIA
jgi:hypothetical protein